MTPNERIKGDAERYTKDEGYQKVYIAGATAEHDRAKVLVDALRKFISYHETGLLPARHVYEKGVKALKQWEGKEVGNPCPHCGKELFRDRNLCCRSCRKEVGDGLP